MLFRIIIIQKLCIPSVKGCRGKTLPQAKASSAGHFHNTTFKRPRQDDGLYKSRSIFVKNKLCLNQWCSGE